MQRVKLTQDCLTLFQFALAKEKRAKERKRKLEKRQTVLREFDPLHDKTKAKLGVKRSQLLSLVTDCGRRGHSQKHYKRSRLHDRKFVFANRVVNNFLYLRFVLIVPSVLRHWWC